MIDKTDMKPIEITNKSQTELLSEIYELMPLKSLCILFIIYLISIFLILISLFLIPNQHVMIEIPANRALNNNYEITTELKSIESYYTNIKFGFSSKSLFSKPLIAVASGSFTEIYNNSYDMNDKSEYKVKFIPERSISIDNHHFSQLFLTNCNKTRSIISVLSFNLLQGSLVDLIIVWKYVNMIFFYINVGIQSFVWLCVVLLSFKFKSSLSKVKSKQPTLVQQLISLSLTISTVFVFPTITILSILEFDLANTISILIERVSHAFYFAVFDVLTWSYIYRKQSDTKYIKAILQFHLFMLLFYLIPFSFSGIKLNFNIDDVFLFESLILICLNSLRLPPKVDDISSELYSSFIHVFILILTTIVSIFVMRYRNDSRYVPFSQYLDILSLVVICFMHWPVDETEVVYETPDVRFEGNALFE